MPDSHPSAAATVAVLGRRLARLRLSRNITQAELARDAGVALRTLRRLEKGRPTALDSFLRVAAALELEEAFLSAVPAREIHPIERIDSRQGRERQRARPKPESEPDTGWTWG